MSVLNHGEGWGIVGLKFGANTFRVSPQCRGNDGVLTLIRILTPVRFSIAKGGAKSKILTSSFPLGVGLIAGH